MRPMFLIYFFFLVFIQNTVLTRLLQPILPVSAGLCSSSLYMDLLIKAGSSEVGPNDACCHLEC